MYEVIGTEDGLPSFFGDYAKALGEIALCDLKKNRTVEITTSAGGKFTYDYMTLDVLLKVANPILAKHGFALFQALHGESGRIELVTELAHKSGARLRVSMGLPGGDPKAVGGAMTYMRRYTAQGLLGVAAEHDADGSDPAEAPTRPRANGAKGRNGGKPPVRHQQQLSPEQQRKREAAQRNQRPDPASQRPDPGEFPEGPPGPDPGVTMSDVHAEANVFQAATEGDADLFERGRKGLGIPDADKIRPEQMEAVVRKFQEATQRVKLVLKLEGACNELACRGLPNDHGIGNVWTVSRKELHAATEEMSRQANDAVADARQEGREAAAEVRKDQT